MQPESRREGLALERRDGGILAVRFAAMASPCEVLLESNDLSLAAHIGRIVADEAWRIEDKFSRYRDGNMLARINGSQGQPVKLDAETTLMIDFAEQCYILSEGRFDITSGVLRRVWHFDGSDRVPEASAVEALLPLIGFDRLKWDPPFLTLPAGMEIDFGGIGKEFAVDRAVELAMQKTDAPLLVNFGGDLRATATPKSGSWRVGIERPEEIGIAALLLGLSSGGLATSGNTRRYLLRDDVRFGHILDPRTGWPVTGAPRSITVAAGTCLEAGMLATMSLLYGPDARQLLDDAGVAYWCADEWID